MTRRFRWFCLGLVVAGAIGVAPSRSQARSSYLDPFNTRYGTANTALDSCTVCHSNTPALNPYGQAYGANGRNLAAIESRDSDGDGFTNLVEINARTFPGNATSKPANPPPPPPPGPPPPPPAGEPDMTMWVDKWFKVAVVVEKGMHVEDIGLMGGQRKAKGYLNILAWDEGSAVLEAVFHQHDSPSDHLLSIPLAMQYMAGDPPEFTFSCSLAGDVAAQFTGRVKGKLPNGTLTRAKIQGPGGNPMADEASLDEEEHEEHAKEPVTMRGRMIPLSKVPPWLLETP